MPRAVFVRPRLDRPGGAVRLERGPARPAFPVVVAETAGGGGRAGLGEFVVGKGVRMGWRAWHML